MSRLAYRPDVDGLRAIAVIAVVVFHAWPELLPGGCSTVAEAQREFMLGADATAFEFDSVRVRSVSWSRSGAAAPNREPPARRRREAEKPRKSRISGRKRRSRMIPASRIADPSRAPEPEGRTSGTP